MLSAAGTAGPCGDFACPVMQRFVPPGVRGVPHVGCNLAALGPALKRRSVGEVWDLEMALEAANVASTPLDSVFGGSFKTAALPETSFDALTVNDAITLNAVVAQGQA